MGRSRSATMVIMYILYKQLVAISSTEHKFTYEKIIKFVQHLRTVVDPNTGFLDQIEKF